MSRINPKHRYLIKQYGDNTRLGRRYVGSTNDLGLAMSLPAGQVLVDTIGEDGLGTADGRRGIADFLKSERKAKP